jgi:hypothetical protein
MVKNGGMELFVGNIPVDWTTTTPAAVGQATAGGLVHTGNSAVRLGNGGRLTQDITPIQEGCFYEFGFFAHGEGANVGLTATLTFLTETGDVPAGEIRIRQGDIPNQSRVYSYYRTILAQAPEGVTGVRIIFNVMAQGQQAVDIDDVSFSTL